MFLWCSYNIIILHTCIQFMFPLLDELMGMTAGFVMTFYKKCGLVIVVDVLFYVL